MMDLMHTPRFFRTLLAALSLILVGSSISHAQEFLGQLSANPYAPESTGNPYGQYGSPYAPNSVNNPYGPYGSPYSPTSVNNPYATEAPRIIAPDGTYLGRDSANPYDPDSTANPYGPYGSPYSPTSINNPYGQYGSPYAPNSARNPYATEAPSIITP
jgi:hypothetical protein